MHNDAYFLVMNDNGILVVNNWISQVVCNIQV